MPLPRRTQRQESHFQARALGWRDDELEGWLTRQLYMERQASRAQGMPTRLPQAGPDGGGSWRAGGGSLLPHFPGTLQGPGFLSTQKTRGEKTYPQADSGKHFNPMESQL